MIDCKILRELRRAGRNGVNFVDIVEKTNGILNQAGCQRCNRALCRLERLNLVTPGHHNRYYSRGVS